MDFDVVDLTSTNTLVREGLTHDEYIRCVAALAACASAGSHGIRENTFDYKVRYIERYIREGFGNG